MVTSTSAVESILVVDKGSPSARANKLAKATQRLIANFILQLLLGLAEFSDGRQTVYELETEGIRANTSSGWVVLKQFVTNVIPDEKKFQVRGQVQGELCNTPASC